jgi:tetratricopeptide (TPR) repeat protein
MPRLFGRGLSQLPRLSENWIVIVAQMRAWIAPTDQAPYRPYVVVVASVEQGTVRGFNVFPTTPTPQQVWETLVQAMDNPTRGSGKRGVPQRIVCAEQTLVESLQPFFVKENLQVEIVQRPLPEEVMEIVRDMEQHLHGGKPEPPALLSVPGVTPELLRGFYAAAAEYYRAAPWVHLSNYQVIALRHPAERDYRYAISMGQAGIEYGLVTYLHWSDVVQQFTEDENPLTMLPKGGWHSLFFDNVTQVPFGDFEAIEKFGFEIAAPEAYPITYIVAGKDDVRRPSRQDLEWYEAALRAIPRLVRDYLKPDGRGDYQPLETTLDVPTHAGTLTVAVKYPAGEIPLEAQPAQRLDWDITEEEDEPEAFDRRMMEGSLQALTREIGGESMWDDPKLERAQELMYRAFEEKNPARRIALAQDALAISPNCADAYVLLAEEAAPTVQRALEYYQQGVAAGERALGKKFFKENVGYFWGILETRPYMRAREGLAMTLWRLRRYDEAREHFQEMLRLNPDDNQGIRYHLLALLLETGKDDEARKLLKQYADEWSAIWLYTRALLEYRHSGASPRANKALADALEENAYVPAYLIGKKRIPNHLPAYISWGDESEAIAYAADYLNHWRRTPGAVEWLSAAKPPQPKTKPKSKTPKRKRAR